MRTQSPTLRRTVRTSGRMESDYQCRNIFGQIGVSSVHVSPVVPLISVISPCGVSQRENLLVVTTRHPQAHQHLHLPSTVVTLEKGEQSLWEHRCRCMDDINDKGMSDHDRLTKVSHSLRERYPLVQQPVGASERSDHSKTFSSAMDTLNSSLLSSRKRRP
jgi:hypothetical protein